MPKGSNAALSLVASRPFAPSASTGGGVEDEPRQSFAYLASGDCTRRTRKPAAFSRGDRWVTKSRRKQLIRNFHENGMKLMLEDAQNVRELLSIAAAEVVELIDFDRMKLLPRTFVKRDYRHVESDVVLSAPLRAQRARQGDREVLVYVLIEHQSQPDRLMPLRILDYVVQVFNYQLRQWSKSQASLAKARLQPVVPLLMLVADRRVLLYPSSSPLDLCQRSPHQQVAA